MGGSGAWFGKIELNPSRVIDEGGIGLASVEDLASVVEGVWEASSEWLEPGCDVGSARVKRVDVACDFEAVESPAFFVRGLLPLRRKWAREQFVYHNPALNKAETLWVGSGAGGVRLYDKAECVRNGGGAGDELAYRRRCKEAEGVLRWEVEARGDWLAKMADIRRVGDVSDDRLRGLTHNRWEWSSMGTEVTGTDAVVERVMAAGLTPTVEAGLLGWIVLTAKGVHRPRNKRTSSRYLQLCHELGIMLTPDVFQDDKAPGRSLDFETGRERVAA